MKKIIIAVLLLIAGKGMAQNVVVVRRAPVVVAPARVLVAPAPVVAVVRPAPVVVVAPRRVVRRRVVVIR
jgi:hypothetical protein